MKLIFHVLRNAEIGVQMLTKYAESDRDADLKLDAEKLTKQQIGCLILLVKSAKGAAKVLTKSMLVNIVRHVN